ncbi:hypothetical protein HRbin10_02410 [bacterium HR10]|nr:hypothetical protein HRbin10_02410 [bacterium HR10]
MKGDDLLERESAHVIAGENQHMLCGPRLEVSPGASDRIRGAAIPLVTLPSLLGRDDLDEFGGFGEPPQPVCLHHMPIERDRVELREHVDAAQPGMQALAERQINEPIVPQKRQRRFGALRGQGEETGTLPEP